MTTYYDDFTLDFNHPTKSLLEQEQELLNRGYKEDDLTRLYPNVIGNGHPNVCLCSECAPNENGYDEHCCSKCGNPECDGMCKTTQPLPELTPIGLPIMLNWQGQGHPDGEPCNCVEGMGCLYEHPF
jgi:hypothetical protein